MHCIAICSKWHWQEMSGSILKQKWPILRKILCQLLRNAGWRPVVEHLWLCWNWKPFHCKKRKELNYHVQCICFLFHLFSKLTEEICCAAQMSHHSILVPLGNLPLFSGGVQRVLSTTEQQKMEGYIDLMELFSYGSSWVCHSFVCSFRPGLCNAQL